MNYAAAHGDRLPPGPAVRRDLPPSRRVGWLALMTPFVEKICWRFDPALPWDDSVNLNFVCLEYDHPSNPRRGQTYDLPVRDWPWVMCRANPDRLPPGGPGPAHIVGIAGLGRDAAAAPPGESQRIGALGDERALKLPGDIPDGAANTMAVAETAGGYGPWTAGGPAALRGLDPDAGPYLGRPGQFGSYHGGVTVGFLDGSARALSPATDPHVFAALATVAGGEGDEAHRLD